MAPRLVGRMKNPQPNPKPAGPLSHLVVDTLSKDKKGELEEAFAFAVHATATPFSFFEHPVWNAFFTKLKPTWKIPASYQIGGPLLDKVYEESMSSTIDYIRESKGATIGIDGATNVMARSICNVILHTPLPMFLEYLVADLRKDTASNVKAKVVDFLTRIEPLVGFKCQSFISDSCNLMIAVRKMLVADKNVLWAYGCAAHALNNFCEDLARACFSIVLKEGLFLAKSIRGKHLLRKLFDTICEERLGCTYSLVLYSKTRWSSISYMVKRLLKTKTALIYLPLSIVADQERLNIDPSLEIPKEVSELIAKKSFWDQLSQASLAFEPICMCIGICESDSATMATAFAALLYVRMHIRQAEWLTSDQRQKAFDDLQRQASRMLSDVHYLAFVCDPFYSSMRAKISDICGADFLQFDSTTVTSHCHLALRMVSSSAEMYDTLLQQYMEFTVSPDETLLSLQDWHPRLLWGQAKDRFKELSTVLCEVYRAPASGAGIERNHKQNKRVHTALRSRLGGGKVEKQVAISHNASQRQREVDHKRSRFEHHLREAARLGSNSSPSTNVERNNGIADECSASDDEDDALHLEALLANASDPSSINDGDMFNDLEPLMSLD